MEYDLCDEDSSDSKRRRSLTDTFDCEMCPEMFVNSDALSKHYRNIHNTDPERMFKRLKQEEQRRMRRKISFVCKNCKRQFCTKALYWSHIATCRRNTARKEVIFSVLFELYYSLICLKSLMCFFINL